MGLIKQILSCILVRIKIRTNIGRLYMGDLFGGKPDRPPPPDTSGIEAVERRNKEKEASASRGIKARQRASSRGGPLLESMQNYNVDTAQNELGSTLGPKRRPT